MKKAVTYAAEALFSLLTQYWAEPDRETKALLKALEAYIIKYQR